MKKNGYENMKILDLAKSVGVSQATIYSMFNNKEGLYKEYVRLKVKEFILELNELTKNSTSYEKLQKFVALKFEYYTNRSRAIESSIVSVNIFYNDKTNPLKEFYCFLTEVFKEINVKIEEKQSIKQAYIFNSFSDGYISLWKERKDFKLLDCVDEVCKKFFLITQE